MTFCWCDKKSFVVSVRANYHIFIRWNSQLSVLNLRRIGPAHKILLWFFEVFFPFIFLSFFVILLFWTLSQMQLVSLILNHTQKEKRRKKNDLCEERMTCVETAFRWFFSTKCPWHITSKHTVNKSVRLTHTEQATQYIWLNSDAQTKPQHTEFSQVFQSQWRATRWVYWRRIYDDIEFIFVLFLSLSPNQERLLLNN